jgi:4-amino-4-deoxy-L-arabinose transferase-like glycosyltransferase
MRGVYPQPMRDAPGMDTVTTPRRQATGMGTHGYPLALVVVVAFAVRLGWLLFALRAPVGFGDAQFYLGTAQRIATGNGYVSDAGAATALWPPGYSFALGAAIWALPFDDIAVAGLLNLVLGTLTVLIVGVLGVRLLGPRSGIIAAFIVAIFPSMVMFTGALLTETLSNFLVVSMLAVLVWEPWTEAASGAVRLPSMRRVAAAGAIGGLAVLVRPPFIASIALIPFAWWYVSGANRRATLARSAVLVAVAAAVVLPWTLRNVVAMGSWVPISNNTGMNLCIGNHPDAKGGFAIPSYCFDDLPTGTEAADEVRRDQIQQSRAITWIVQNPWEQPRLITLKTMSLFSSDSVAVSAVQSFGDDPWLEERHAFWLRWWADSYFWMVFTLAFFGFVIWLRRRDPRVVALLMVAVGVVVITWPFFGDGRFKQPVLPVLAFAATVSLRRLLMQPEPTPCEPLPISDGGSQEPSC